MLRFTLIKNHETLKRVRRKGNHSFGVGNEWVTGGKRLKTAFPLD
jgi:hypothetical protein